MHLVLQIFTAIELLFLESLNLFTKVISFLLELLVFNLLGYLEVLGMLQSLFMLFCPGQLNFALQLLDQLIKVAAGMLPFSLLLLFIIVLVLQLIFQFFVFVREPSNVPVGCFQLFLEILV